jgi:hypothetical protein
MRMPNHDTLGHLLHAVASLPPSFTRLVHQAGPHILELEDLAASTGGSIWVFDVQRAAQREGASPDGVLVQEHGPAMTRLMMTTLGAEPVARRAGVYLLCLVDGDDVRCLPIEPMAGRAPWRPARSPLPSVAALGLVG